MTTSWLIESRDPQTQQTHDYVEDIDPRYPRIVFTKDASKAARFDAKGDAQNMLDSCRTIDPDGLFVVEDHAFDCGIAPVSSLPIPRFLRKNDD